MSLTHGVEEVSQSAKTESATAPVVGRGTTLEIGASSIYYELYDHHPGIDRPTVVLLHGVGGNHASWFQQTVHWREQYRLLIVDARGFGRSLDAEGAGRARFVDDLTAVLDATASRQVVLVAQSMGGGTATAFACRHPGRVAALVLACTLVGFALPDELQSRMDDLDRRNLNLSQVDRVLGASFVQAHPAMAELYLQLASFNHTTVRTLTGRQETHTPASLGDTGIPVLFIVGSEDVLFPPTLVRAVQALVSGAELVELKACGHSAYFEDPDSFNEVVAAWLARQVPALC